MASIDIADLSFSHDGGQPLFDHVFLRLDTRWKLGLIGRNGRGKTTLLKLLAGEYAYSGTISSPAGFDYFPFDVPDPALDGRALAMRLRGLAEADMWKLEREASLIDLPQDALDRPFATLSGGEATKLLLCLLFAREDRFLLIDEPTNHLDAHGRKAVGEYLRGKEGFILVSHDRALLDACVDHVLAINRAGLELQRGNYSSWKEQRDRQDRREDDERQRLRKEAARLKESVRRAADWSLKAESGKYGAGPVDRGFIGHKAAKMMKRATVTEARRQKALDETSDLLRNLESAPPLLLTPLVFPAERLAEGFDLGLSFDGKTVLENVSFRLLRGDRLVLRGRNGSGKSSLLRALAGQAVPFSGELYRAANLRVSYVPQDASFVRGRIRDFARERGIDESRFRAVLDRLGFARAQFEEDMAGYSAGQKKKVLLAASLCEEAHLYAWDEPLNYLDILSRVQIEDLILAARPTMVLVEHDRAFTDSVGTAFLDLDGGE